MEITDIDFHALRIPNVEDVADGSQSVGIIEVITDEGVVGVGQVSCISPIISKAILEAPMVSSVCMGLKKVLIGRDPFDVEVLWDDMYDKTYAYGRKGAAIITMSGVDLALWDIIGKETNRPLYQLLGGKHRNSVRAYASTLFPEDPKDSEHMRREAERAEEAGFTAIKYGWGAFTDDAKDDRQLIRAAREALDSETALMLDAGMGWGMDVKRAIKEINELHDRFDIYWVEEPVYADNLDGYRKISQSCDTRIVGGEREYTLYGFWDFINRGLVDGVQPDAAVSGGITHLQKIASLAATKGIPIYPHGYSTDIVIAANLHIIAANRNAPLLEYCVEESPLRWEVVNEEFPVRDGKVSVPARPGLGVTLNHDVIEKYKVEPWNDW